MVDNIQVKTCFFFLVFTLFLAFQLILPAAHRHKTEVGSAQDPVKICHLDISLQLDLCLSVQFSVGCIRKIPDPCIFLFRCCHFLPALLHFLKNILVSFLNGKELFSFFCEIFFPLRSLCALFSDLRFRNFSDLFLLHFKSLYGGSYPFFFCLKSLQCFSRLSAVFLQASVLLLSFPDLFFQIFFTGFPGVLGYTVRFTGLFFHNKTYLVCHILLLFLILGCFHPQAGLLSVKEILFFKQLLFFLFKTLQGLFHCFLSFCIFLGFPDFFFTFRQKILALFLCPFYHRSQLFPHSHKILCLSVPAFIFLMKFLKLFQKLFCTGYDLPPGCIALFL